MAMAREASMRSGLSETSSRGEVAENLQKRNAFGTKNEEEDVLEQKKSFQEAIFSSMYTLARSKTADSRAWVTVKIILEGLIPFLVIFNPNHWPINTSNPVWLVIRWAQPVTPITRIWGYTVYIRIFYVLVAIIFSVVVAITALTIAMRRQDQSKGLRHFARLLQTFTDAMFSMLYVAIFDYILFLFDCRFGSPGHPHNYFPGIQCLSGYYAVHLAVGVVTAVVFFLVTALMLVAVCDLSPVARGILASPAAVARLQVLALKAAFVIAADTLVSVGKVQAVVMVVIAYLITYVNFRTLPFLRLYINDLWVGVWFAVSYMCTVHVVMDFKDHRSVAETYKLIVLYGVFPAVLVGAGITALWSRFRLRPAAEFRGVDPATASTLKVHKFSAPDEVEFLARSMRHFNSDDVLFDESAQLGETIIKFGMAAFPNNVSLLVLYANFLLDVRRDGPVARTQLQLALKAGPSIIQRYGIFSTIESSKRLKDGQEGTLDLQSYVEFKRNYRAVIRVHKAALGAQRDVWQLLQRPVVRTSAVEIALRSMAAAADVAHQVYKRVLDRYPNNGKLLRCYGKFLEDVRNDPIAAARVYAEAARNGGGDGLLSLDLQFQGATKPEFLTSMDMHEDACIIINAEGKMLMVNSCVSDLLGYPRIELEGANVSMIMPQPFCSRHNGYLERYAQGGEPHILDTVRDVVALHKERYVFPLQLCVTKLSGIGKDAVFLGLLRPAPFDARNLRAWVAPNGVILCADPQFSSLTGMLAEDMVGRNVRTLVTDMTVADSLLELCHTAPYEQLVSGAIVVRMEMAHRYLPPVPVEVKVTPGGTDAQRILVINARRTDGSTEGLMVVDARGGLAFATWDVAAMLGYPLRSFLRMRLEQLLPQPFATMHARHLREAPPTVPPVSCRAGMAVNMVNSSGANVPVRLRISSREDDLMGAKMKHVVQVTKVDSSTLTSMFTDKRLSLTCTMDGKILAVDQPTSNLFGFAASAVVGSNLADCIDVFSDWRTKAGAHQLELLLLSLLDKEAEMPGTSWRVKVHSPENEQDVHLPDIRPRTAGTRRPTGRSACLQTEIIDTVELLAAGVITSADLGRTTENPVGSVGEATRSSSRGLPLMTAKSMKLGGAAGAAADEGAATILARITLWRRDLLTGVVDLDEKLIIRKADNNTGLIVGLPTSALQRLPLYRLLDVNKGITWNELTASDSKKPALKNGLMRVSEPKAFIGPHPDGGTMRIILQGVSGGGRITATLHPDTTYVGARANVYRALGLETIIHHQQQLARSQSRPFTRQRTLAKNRTLHRNATFLPGPGVGPARAPSRLLLPVPTESTRQASQDAAPLVKLRVSEGAIAAATLSNSEDGRQGGEGAASGGKEGDPRPGGDPRDEGGDEEGEDEEALEDVKEDDEEGENDVDEDKSSSSIDSDGSNSSRVRRAQTRHINLDRRNSSSSSSSSNNSSGLSSGRKPGGGGNDDAKGSKKKKRKQGSRHGVLPVKEGGKSAKGPVAVEAGPAAAADAPSGQGLYKNSETQSQFISQWVRSLSRQMTAVGAVQSAANSKPTSRKALFSNGDAGGRTASRGGSPLNDDTTALLVRASTRLMAYGATGDDGGRRSNILGAGATRGSAAKGPEGPPVDPLMLSRVEDEDDDEMLRAGITKVGPDGSPRATLTRRLSSDGGMSYAPGGGHRKGEMAGVGGGGDGADKDATGANPKGSAPGAPASDGGSSLGDDDDASQGGGGPSISDFTSGMDVDLATDARRARLLRRMMRIMYGPSLAAPLARLFWNTNWLLITMMASHVVCYAVFMTLITEQYGQVHALHRTALSADRCQVAALKAAVIDFCSRPGVDPVSACSASLESSVADMRASLDDLESYHQGIYLGVSQSPQQLTDTTMFTLWTNAVLPYRVFLDVEPPRWLNLTTGVWQLGNRFIATGRELLYWAPKLGGQVSWLRPYYFLQANGPWSLFRGYAMTLDLMAEHAWEDVTKLQTSLIIILLLEAAGVQLACIAYEWWLVRRVEQGRRGGMLVGLGLPGPILRILANKPLVVMEDSDDEEEADQEEDGVQDGGGGGGGGHDARRSIDGNPGAGTGDTAAAAGGASAPLPTFCTSVGLSRGGRTACQRTGRASIDFAPIRGPADLGVHATAAAIPYHRRARASIDFSPGPGAVSSTAHHIRTGRASIDFAPMRGGPTPGSQAVYWHEQQQLMLQQQGLLQGAATPAPTAAAPASVASGEAPRHSPAALLLAVEVPPLEDREPPQRATSQKPVPVHPVGSYGPSDAASAASGGSVSGAFIGGKRGAVTVAKEGSNRLTINGKVLVSGRRHILKFMVPLVVWELALAVVGVLSYIWLQDMEGPLASLNMASHVIYRYTRVRMSAFMLVSSNTTDDRAEWRTILRTELANLRDEYDTLLYGGRASTQAGSAFQQAVPASTFESESFAANFFTEERCFRWDQSNCYTPDNPYYEVTHHGLDVMMRRVMSEMSLLAVDDDVDVAYNGTRYTTVYAVGVKDLYEGLQSSAELFVNFMISRYENVKLLNTILLVLTIILLICYAVFVLRPYRTTVEVESGRLAGLLSHVPAEMDVATHARLVQREYGKVIGTDGIRHRKKATVASTRGAQIRDVPRRASESGMSGAKVPLLGSGV